MSPVYQAPGVFVEEKDSGNKPIETVGTSVVGFLGMCAKGSVNQPKMITNWAQFTNEFGDFEHSKYLAHAVYGFFANGGSRCYVTNVGDGKDDKKGPMKADGKESDGKKSNTNEQRRSFNGCAICWRR